MNEEEVKEIVKRETEYLEKRIEQLECELLLTKQHTTQAVQLMAEKFSSELDRVLVETHQRYLQESLVSIKKSSNQ
ncbi:hypothetical protein M3201_18675 [Paenibacillus motobuensis]|uniref:hypothetical protein n=1 Tax=Paenibacillus TaxID=44249 RepID=UPI00203F1399|nr:MULTISPECIES: hypothetical protein [Paenibacillus]MCM3041722.1 hypothetical protein [Paenibacillus lutimineralis]MCM3648826.1 hypothetical protein [Paenibacillus motobuensis]